MLGQMINLNEVGYYENAEKLINVPLSLILSVTTVLLPKLSNDIANNVPKEQTQKILGKTINYTICFTSLVSFGIMGVSNTFIPFFFGSGYEKCVNLLDILMPSCIIVAIGNIIRLLYLIPNKLDHIYIKGIILGAITNISINLLLIPSYLSIGAAIATFFSECMVTGYQCFAVKKDIPITFYIRKTSIYIFSGIIMFFLLMNLKIQISNDFILIIIKAIIGLIVYFTIIYLLRLLMRRSKIGTNENSSCSR